MARNSLGQFIVQESGSSVVSIKCDELYITKTQYDLFLLDNKEFTELTPTIDKDALINSLTNEITGLNNRINNILATNASGGFVVSVTNPQYSYPVDQTDAITYNNQTVYNNIGFNDDNTLNSVQSNGLKFWSIPNKEATVYQDANSRGFYNLNAYIKFRFKYIGNDTITDVTNMQTKLQFYKLTDGKSNIITLGNGVTINRTLTGPDGNIKKSYSQGDVTNTYEINLNKPDQELGIFTDIIYLPVEYSFFRGTSNIRFENFIMEILPGSTFSMLSQ